ncbi:DUF6183 family protein [Streptomyces gobitricini]|uniref:Uncharacterized protein n=1 Tax=Streptomyces gobitricini TaxID=68211 RepID=A0ABP6AMN3_9ACTN
MESSVRQFMHALAHADNTQTFTDEVTLRVGAGDLDWIGALGAAIVGATGSEAWQYRSVYDHLQRALAKSPGRNTVRQLLRLPLALRPGGPGEEFRTRHLAMELAYHQSAEDLACEVFEAAPGQDVPYELRACLLHELVQRPVPVDEHPALRSFAATLTADGHPLAQLPCHLVPLEQVERDPSWFPMGPVSRVPKEPLITTPAARRRAAGTKVTEVDDWEQDIAMNTVVEDWRTSSNGRVTAHVFTVEPALDRGDFGALFSRLPLACRRDAPELWTTTAGTVLGILRAAASGGGAYTLGSFGAYGRLAAWQSLAGLVGLPAHTPLPETARRAEQTHWYLFDTEADWFEAVAWDIAIAALRPGAQEIAVLAATDTD